MNFLIKCIYVCVCVYVGESVEISLTWLYKMCCLIELKVLIFL